MRLYKKAAACLLTAAMALSMLTACGGGGTGEQTYTVVSGDNLSRIAKHFYGKPDWKPIFDANRDQLDNPDKIFPGQVLKIPAHD